MKAAAIDMCTLKGEAFGGEGATTVVDRTWLQDVYRALNGELYADVSECGDVPAMRQAQILGAVDGMLLRRAA